MRIALLSTLDTDGSQGEVRAAFRRFAGVTIAEHQLDLALRIGCDHIICLADSIGAQILDLQNRAEMAGVKFRAVKSAGRLPGMIGREDELVLLSSGLLADEEAAIAAMQCQCIPAFPADIAVHLGYERIDLGLAWSGILRAPGELAGELEHLPEDVDVVSALLRIALQNGVMPTLLDRGLISKGDWQLVPDVDALAAREKRWIDAQRENISFRAPGMAIAERAGARLARDIIGKKTEFLPSIIAMACAVGAVFTAFFNLPSYGLVFATFVALFNHLATVVDRVASKGRSTVFPNYLRRILKYMLDPLFVILLGLIAPEGLSWMGFFAPLVLFGLLQLGETYANNRWRRSYADRISVGILLSAAAFLQISAEMTAILALLVLVSRFFRGARAV